MHDWRKGNLRPAMEIHQSPGKSGMALGLKTPRVLFLGCGSSVPGIFQARILEWFAISFFMEKSLQLDKFGTKVISQRSSICEGTDIIDVVFGKLLNNSVWTGCRNLLRKEAKDRVEPRSWALY